MRESGRGVLFFYAGVIALVAVVFGLVLYQGSSDDDDGADATVPSVSPRKSTPATVAEFVSPLDGETVSNPVEVRLAVGGLMIKDASQPASPGQGHFRLLLDGDEPAPGEAPPEESTLVDLVDGSHVVTLPPLSPGPHTLLLVFEDSNHVPVPGVLFDSITITVEK